MKNKTIRFLAAGFGLTFFLLIISSIASYVSIDRLIESSERVKKAYTISLELEKIISNTKDAETGFRGYLITRDSLFLSPYYGAYERTIDSYEKVKTLATNNPIQQQRITELRPLLEKRFGSFENQLQQGTGLSNYNKQIHYEGKATMDKARVVVNTMQDEELQLLASENTSLQKYVTATPVLVVLAAFLSLLIIVVAFLRIRTDITKREELQAELEQNVESVKQRIAIISSIAEKISAGDYSSRIADKNIGELGGLAEALNQMASDLEENFTKLDIQAWFQKGVAELNNQLQVEKNLPVLTHDVLAAIVQYFNANVGIMYLVQEQGDFLKPSAGYACKIDINNNIAFGEGLVGQVAHDKAPLVLQNVPGDLFRVNSGLLDGPPASVIIYPLVYNDRLEGIIEIGTVQKVPPMAMEYLGIVATNTAIAIKTAQNKLRVQELLQETQAQSEELQVQQDELQHSNVELEMQTQRLQASEEELRVQQEELLQSNQELEEKAQLLEEKNLYIAQKSFELSLLNDDVEQKNKDLELASRYKSEFLANMSHELRTPLNSILLLAKLLAESKELELGDDRYEYAKVIHSSGIGLLEIINEILDLSKIEAGQMQLFIEEVPFEVIEKDLAQMFAPLAEERGLELTLEFDASLPPFLQSDKQRLEQVLKNLLSNAIKFTEKGYVRLHVFANSISTNSQTPIITFAVQDSGIGIPADKQDLVFEAFKQVDGSTRRKYAGTGLGLSISRELTKLLGGEIKLESTDGKGSLFTVTLPLYYTEQATILEDTLPQTEEMPVALAPIPVAEPTLSVTYVPDDRESILPGDKTILIIEDDIPFVKALSPFVKNNGYKVLIATHGEDGLILARHYQPIGILLDINLPVMDGWTVIQYLKDDSSTRHIPVHTMSSDEARQRSLQSGAIDFINKPLTEQELSHVLKRMVEAGKKESHRLLLIDENEKHATALSAFFRQHAIDTTIALSGEEGMHELRTGAYNGVILDISVDEKTAFGILDQIKTDRRYESMPVIVYTRHNITTDDENHLSKYATTSIVRKANTYQSLLNEVSIFLHLVQRHVRNDKAQKQYQVIEQELKGKTILLADDDERNLYSLTKVLEMNQVKVITASNGKQVLDYLVDAPQIDAILIDIMMPEMDGYEAISLIRQKPKYKKIPIIAVTAKTMPTDRNKCIEAGASDYISKPVDADQLLSLLRVWLYNS